MVVHCVFHRFKQPKFAHGGSRCFKLELIFVTAQLPQKIMLTSKQVKIDLKKIILLPRSKSVKLTVVLLKSVCEKVHTKRSHFSVKTTHLYIWIRIFKKNRYSFFMQLQVVNFLSNRHYKGSNVKHRRSWMRWIGPWRTTKTPSSRCW